MSSPNESISDFDDSASTKKRVRDQSVDPEEKPVDTQVSAEMSIPKKTKHEGAPTSVRTIRRNLKDMSTTDNPEEHGDHQKESQESPDVSDTDDAAVESHTQECDFQQPSQQSQSSEDSQSDRLERNDDSNNNSNQEQVTGAADKAKSVLSKFGGGVNNDDWSEFAEEDEDNNTAADAGKDDAKTTEEKPKYTFGATSGFGMKGWGATTAQLTSPSTGPVNQKHTFGGFSSGSFGGFGSSTQSSTPATTFASFASASATPFALAAATSTAEEATTGPTTSDNGEQNETSEAVDQPGEIGSPRDSAKAKALRQAEVKTGEEDEQTIYHIKGKLFVMDGATGNWKERGAGTLRINIRENASEKHARIVMRADTVYRVILNLPLFEGMQFLIMQDKFVRFAGFESIEKDGKLETKVINYALRVANPSTALELQQQLNACVSK